MESNHDGNQKENNNDITTLPNDIATNTSTTNDNNLTANTKDNFIDDEEIEIDLDKAQFAFNLTAFETIMKPREILQEFSIKDMNEPVEKTITVSTAYDFSDFINCPICRGKLNSTLAALPCLHRFCEECIKMHLSKTTHSCPLCRKALASRRNCRKDPNYDKLVAILSKSSSQKDDVMSSEEIFAYYYNHLASTEQLKIQGRERQFQLSNKSPRSQSNDSMLGKRSQSGESIAHVTFILQPITLLDPINTNDDDNKLKKPFLRAPAGVTIIDLINFLKTKSQFHRMEFDILIKYHDELIPLNDDITLKDICINYYKDAASELILYFRKKQLL